MPARPRLAVRTNRPQTQITTIGLAAHVFFELAAGVGMPLASVLRPAPAAALWGSSSWLAWRAARKASPSADPMFGLLNAAGLAAVVAHLSSWPSRRTRLGLPWLEDCEGLGPDLMWAYNPILYATGAAAVLALLRENRSAPAALMLLPPVLAPVFAAAQHAEFRRLQRLAESQPGWWNRRLR